MCRAPSRCDQRRGGHGPCPPRGEPVRTRRVPRRARGCCRSRPRVPRTSLVTRFEPELYVPPQPGDGVVPGDRAASVTRLCTSTRWRSGSLPGRARQPADLHRPVVPGRAPRRAREHLGHLRGRDEDDIRKLSCCTRSSTARCSGDEAANTKALIFNVKGEDLLFLDKPNSTAHRRATARNTPPRPSRRRHSSRSVDLGAGQGGSHGRGAGHRQPSAGRGRLLLDGHVTSCATRLLRFLFAEEGDERSQDRRPGRPRRAAA